jgi:hypothetical protein
MYINLTKIELFYMLGDFFSNLSGHPSTNTYVYVHEKGGACVLSTFLGVFAQPVFNLKKSFGRKKVFGRKKEFFWRCCCYVESSVTGNEATTDCVAV